MDINNKRTWISSLYGGFRIRAWLFLGIVVLISVFAYFGIKTHMAWRQKEEFSEILYHLTLLEQNKQEVAFQKGYANGFPITLDDIKIVLPDFYAEALRRFIDEEGPDGKLTRPATTDVVFIINPVGIPAKARLLRNLAGHSTGFEITASRAEIIRVLNRLNSAKEAFAQANHWGNGHLITFDDIRNVPDVPGITNGFNNSISFILNPVGIPPTARIVRPWEDLPNGLEISPDF